MAFNVGAAIGGVAKSLSKGFEDERNEALELATQKIKIFTELGLPKARARKEQLRSKNELFDKLSKDFSTPQIAVIMREGRGEEVLTFVQNQRDLFGEAGVKPADIVAISPDYKDTGLTKDRVLENVMGKINKGMSPTGAINDTFDKSLTNFFGGDLGSVGKRQMQSMAEATGVSMAELQALASDDITKDPKLVEGTIRMFDPVKAKAAQEALEPSKQGFTASQFTNYVAASAGTNAQIGLNELGDGTILYKPQSDQRNIVVEDLVSATLAAYEKSRVDTGKYTFGELRNVQQIINEQLISLGYMQTGQQPPPGSGQQQSAVGAATTSFSGMTANNIISQAVKEAKGLKLPNGQPDTTAQSLILMRARNAIIADLKKNARPGQSAQDIANEADKIVADIKSQL